MSNGAMHFCVDPHGDQMIYAAPFPAADPGPSAEPGEQWKCLGWGHASDPWFSGGRTRIDVTFLESLNPAVRAIADAPRDDPAAPDGWALVIDARDGDTVIRSFVPQARPGEADESDDMAGVRIEFAAHSHERDSRRFSVRRYTNGGDRELVPFFCA